MQTVHYETRDDVAVIHMNRPPVNSLGHPLRKDLHEAIARALADASVKALVVTGTDKAFSGGADISEFGGPLPSTEPRLASVIEQMESADKPIVAAISGICLGGGLELALGAHERVAHVQARIGLPEVKLGILPGGGGTQRLPRLVGLKRALTMITEGLIVRASTLSDTRLFAQVVDEDIVSAAIQTARELAAKGAPYRRVRDIDMDEPNAQAILDECRQKLAGSKDKAMQLAQQNCLESVAGTVNLPFSKGLEQERALINMLMESSQSKALRHIFFAERAVTKIPGVAADTPIRDISRVGVIGAGTMGGGIAMSMLNAGIPVTLVEATQQALDRGVAIIERNYENTASKGRITAEDVQKRMALLTPSLAYEDLSDADLVIEAVFEDMDVKKSVFGKLDAICKSGAILASNTSYLNIDELAATTSRPGDVLGLHFFSPANVMKLLEIVRGDKTSNEVLTTCMSLARRIGKIAVVAGVCDGFIGNRMVARYTAAAHGLVVQGAAPQQVDQALEAYGFSMGPLRMGDLAGLDIGYATRKRYKASAPDQWYPHIADDLVEQGRLGQKSGSGWYRYEPGNRQAIPDPQAEEIIRQFRQRLGVSPRVVTDEEVVARCVGALINEGARILEEGIALRPSDIDVVYLNGYAFPRQHGGPMFYADQIGLDKVLADLQRFCSEPGAKSWWQPASLIVSLVNESKSLSQWQKERA
ncbi:3-hydroxyacyl-CoA dehydrogenase NAD-binding domain-containing protein [Orrella marina]|uniref:3-hydroxyacyl-CoA dehydrogenase n=1 Tax=Orrella marina TaxID=2163011 RepID=A0A2R4XGA0_9BURK|nr:3-hydroxyacyl-CoA dehydrogenase NAD-binding domain-containing protein [Orrella marina]AWB32842.1 3-hydroxyacyl-CoA dehydrogenase [Orrella marina]